MGFVKIDRKIFGNPIWKEKPFSKGQAWVDLLLLAHYRQEKKDYRGTIVTMKRGSIHCSIRWLSDRWGWKKNDVRKYLKYLKEQKMIKVDTIERKVTIITIVNYSVYQDKQKQDSEDKFKIDWDKIPD